MSRPRASCSRSWSARGWSSWRSSGASRPGCSSTAWARRSRPSTRSTCGRCARADESRPRCGRRRAPGRASWAASCSTRAPGSTAASSSSTSRASTRASSAPSTSIRSPTCPPPVRSRRSARPAAPVIYGDTDSLFVDIGEPDPARAAARGEELRAAIGGAVGDAVAREFGCTSHLELEFEKVYARFFMPEVRGGAMGSKKRYAGLVVTASGEEIEFVGLEAVRRDWSGVARRFQRVLLDLVFHDRPVADFIRGFVADLRAGRFDGELAYRKAIRKPLAEYTKTTPPHVKAARKQAGATGRIVTYVVTRSGPETVGETTAPPDYDHYVTQQLRPIADAVLRFLGGPDFDGITGARRQLTLFS